MKKFHSVKKIIKAGFHKIIHKIKNIIHKFKAQEQYINNIKLFFKATIVTLIILFSLLIIAGKNKTTAEILLDEFVNALKSKLGFEYSSDPLSDYVFNKFTPNYNAYAGDKKLAGIHRMMLERDGIKMEIKFQSAEIAANRQNSAEADISSAPDSTSSADINPIQTTINNLNSQLEEITTGLQDISEKISDIRQNVSEISSRAKMVAENQDRKIEFQDIVYGTDIVYGLNEGGIKQEIILKSRENLKNIFNFTLNTPDMSYKDVGRGVWYFSNKENKIMRLPKAYATDTNGKFTNDVDIRVKTTLLVTIMTVEVPLDWLQDKNRVFPVTIHTAFEIVPALRDGKSKAPSGSPADSETTPDIDLTSAIEATTGAVIGVSTSASSEATESSVLSATDSSKVDKAGDRLYNSN